MAEKTVISIEVDGVQKSINSVKELKDSISDLQKIAENADIGSERQKEAVKQIDNLNSQLKQLTQTEEQYAKSLEDVAKAEKEAIKETQDLRKQFEVLEDELFLLAGQGKQNTKEFRNLTIEAAALNKKIDAVNSSLGENSAGRASAGFSQLSDGLKNLDFDSVKKGLAVMKTALAATGIMLLVQGVMYLYENFEELSKGSGVLAKILRGVGDAISYVKNFVTDLVGATTESSRALEKQGEDMVKANDKSQEALKNTTSEFDRQLAVAKAAGKSTIEIEKLKQQAIIDTNVQIAKSIEAQVRAGGEFTDEMKKQLSGSLEAIKNAKVKEYEITKEDDKNKKEKSKERLANNLEAIKKIEDAQIAAIKNEELRLISAEVKANERRIKEIKDGKESAELKRQELEAQAVLYEQNISKINADAAAKRKAEEDKIAADKKAEDEKKLKELEDEKKKQLLLEQRDLKANNELKLLAAGEDSTKQLEAKKEALNIQRDIELSNTELTESERAAIKAKYAKASADLDEGFETDKQKAAFELTEKSLIASQNLSNAFFAIKMANVRKGSKEEEDLARKQFNINKGIQISLAIISGVQGVLNALSAKSILPEPFATGVRIANAIAVGTASIAAVAKISSTQFQSAGGGGAPSISAGSSTSSPSMPDGNGTPSIAAPQQNTTTFTGNNNNNFNQPPIKTYVVETDLRNSTNTIDKIKDQATF
jgi:hypothetical protein